MNKMKYCTNPEVSCLKVSVGDLVARLQLTEIKRQDVLNLLIEDLSQDPPSLLVV